MFPNCPAPSAFSAAVCMLPPLSIAERGLETVRHVFKTPAYAPAGSPAGTSSGEDDRADFWLFAAPNNYVEAECCRTASVTLLSSSSERADAIFLALRSPWY